MKIFKNYTLIKYAITGTIFTIFSPLIFIFLSNYLSRVLVILILEPLAFSLKFLVYKLWVFKRGRVVINNYLLHIFPLYLNALLIAKITENIKSVEFVALLIILINGLIGYIWGNYIYSSKNFSNF